MSCDCRICRLGRRVKTTVAERDTDKLIALVNDLSDLWFHTDFDNDYYRCIMDGSWPSAKEILQRAMDRADYQKAKTCSRG